MNAILKLYFRISKEEELYVRWRQYYFEHYPSQAGDMTTTVSSPFRVSR